MIVEICSNSFESVLAATKGGAHRIELCTNLSVGGLTPSFELIEKVMKEIEIPVHVLIRPRKGNFIYSEAEVSEMIKSITFCNKMGCKGIVSGALTSENKIDVNTVQHLMNASKGMDFTFHRAFDCLDNAMDSLKQLMNLKITRLLSSGQKQTALEGITLLTKLNTLSKGRIEIMPGSGINTTNAKLFKKAGFNSIHLSAIAKPKTTKKKTSFFEGGFNGISDLKTISEIVSLVS